MQSFLKSGKLGSSCLDKGASTSKTSKKSKLVPWVEKYRPETVNDVVEQNEVVAVLEQCISGADLPNLLFYGPPGTGKTSTILAAAKQLFGDIYRERILELNASDERGIQVIRDKVKSFSQLTASAVRPDGKPCPPFKIVILDEADSMTHAAQAALRRTMEKETKTTRFCLICNYVSRIIEPLTSRCSKFRFKPLNEARIHERLRLICDKEGINCDDTTLNTLVETSGGDMRRAITCLQSCSKLQGSDSPISEKTVLEVTGVVPSHWLNEFVEVCKKKNYMEAVDFIKKFGYEAYSASQFLEQFNEYLIESDIFSDEQKAIIGDKLGSVNFYVQDGGSEYIQLCSLAATVCMVYS
ncbi:replication factor C subunit 4 [Coccinella septempunctata]|uniref:replication factor C subunit 4 n=1 Tax=Coccinella septempunctata TaxID=41139 RepID=UPI001D060D4F|nr:replication factor C subunit 4 [Coccinella septempunctata]